MAHGDGKTTRFFEVRIKNILVQTVIRTYVLSS